MHVLSIIGALTLGVLLAGYAAAFLLVLGLRALTAVLVSPRTHAEPAKSRRWLPSLPARSARRARPAAEPQLRTT